MTHGHNKYINESLIVVFSITLTPQSRVFNHLGFSRTPNNRRHTSGHNVTYISRGMKDIDINE